MLVSSSSKAHGVVVDILRLGSASKTAVFVGFAICADVRGRGVGRRCSTSCIWASPSSKAV